MKTKEEIEQLASKRFTIKQFIGEDDYNRNETIAARCGYTEGYTQCQQDMDDKIKEAYEQGLKDGYACMPSINSLNKQD